MPGLSNLVTSAVTGTPTEQISAANASAAGNTSIILFIIGN